MTVVELLFTTTVIALAIGISIPGVWRGLDRARSRAAARYLAQQCGLARLDAVSRGRYVALQFVAAGDDFAVQVVADGNRNGVRTDDIEAGVDRPISARSLLAHDYAGVRIALDTSLGLGSDPIRVGGARLLSFSPHGTATSGTVYVLGRDGVQLAVRVLGATGRSRVLRYDAGTARWEEL
jgi:Tfp pilus assembly protein FimT